MNKLEKIKESILLLEERIVRLENLSKCKSCKGIYLLFNCNTCNERICDNCSRKLFTKTYNGDICIYFCKDCR